MFPAARGIREKLGEWFVFTSFDVQIMFVFVFLRFD